MKGREKIGRPENQNIEIGTIDDRKVYTFSKLEPKGYMHVRCAIRR